MVIGRHNGASTARGRLHVFLGATPGAGKTYAMLAAGARLADAGTDVVVALVETHGRQDLGRIATQLDVIAPRRITYRGTEFHEPDYDAVRARRPDVVLVDELAHTNVPGSRHEKRWQDVKELLDAGIDVMTTLNIAHLASLQEEVERITKVEQREFVPEEMVVGAEHVEFIDAHADTVLARLGPRGKFFDPDRLAALRDVGLRWLDQHGLAAGLTPPHVATTRSAPVVVAVAPGAPARLVVRRAAELAAQRRAELIGVHVREATGLVTSERDSADLERMLEQFGGRYTEVAGNDVAVALARFAGQEKAGMVVIGDTSHSTGQRLMHGSIARRTLRLVGPIEVHVVPPGTVAAERPFRGWNARDLGRITLPPRRRLAGWLLALLLPTALMALLVAVRAEIGLAGALLCALLSVVLAALVGGVGAALLATVTALLSADFFFAAPYYSLRLAHWVDIVALMVFSLVGMIVGFLVDVLVARARQTMRFRAEAAQLARLAARVLLGPATSRADLVAELRRTFDLDGVGILSRSVSGWHVEVSAGAPPSDDPGDAQFSAELAHDQILVMTGRELTRSDAELVRVFCGELLLARRRAQHDELRGIQVQTRKSRASRPEAKNTGEAQN